MLKNTSNFPLRGFDHATEVTFEQAPVNSVLVKHLQNKREKNDAFQAHIL
jgi:hypothetical protein